MKCQHCLLIVFGIKSIVLNLDPDNLSEGVSYHNSPLLSCSRHTGHSAAPQTVQLCSHLRVFAIVVLFAWSSLIPRSSLVATLCNSLHINRPQLIPCPPQSQHSVIFSSLHSSLSLWNYLVDVFICLVAVSLQPLECKLH